AHIAARVVVELLVFEDGELCEKLVFALSGSLDSQPARIIHCADERGRRFVIGLLAGILRVAERLIGSARCPIGGCVDGERGRGGAAHDFARARIRFSPDAASMNALRSVQTPLSTRLIANAMASIRKVQSISWREAAS